LCPHDILLYGPYDFFDSILPVHKEKSHYYFTDRAVSGLGMTLTWPCQIPGHLRKPYRKLEEKIKSPSREAQNIKNLEFRREYFHLKGDCSEHSDLWND